MDVPNTTRAAFLFSLGLLCLKPELAFTQTSAGGARDAALGGSSAAAADLWAEANPAGWARLDAFAAAIHVAQLYNLDELRLGAVQAGFLLGKTVIVSGVRTLGYADYRETILSAGAARGIRWGTHRPLYAGIRLRLHRTDIRSYGSASAYAASAGLVVPIAQHADLGLAAENLFVFPGSLKNELPRRLHAGLSISAGAVSLQAGAVKDVRMPLAARFGVEVQPVDVLALRAGYSLEPPRFAGGIGLRLTPLTVDVAAERHLVLGWTPSCSVGVKW